MRKPLSKQEMHNLAMNHVGKDLESRGFEFVAIISKLKKHPQFVCIDKNSQYFFVIVRVVKLPENPNNYDLVWMENFKKHAMEKDAKFKFKSLKVDGGASNNNLLMQIQSNLLGVNVIRPKTTETTALGAAFFAGLASGFWSSLEKLSSVWDIDTEFNPKENEETLSIINNWEKRILIMSNSLNHE